MSKISSNKTNGENWKWTFYREKCKANENRRRRRRRSIKRFDHVIAFICSPLCSKWILPVLIFCSIDFGTVRKIEKQENNNERFKVNFVMQNVQVKMTKPLFQYTMYSMCGCIFRLPCGTTFEFLSFFFCFILFHTTLLHWCNQ